MTFSTRALWLSLVLAVSAGMACLPVSAQTPSQTQGSVAQTYAFVFRDAEIGQVAEEILGNALGVSYRVEPGVTGKLNFRIEQRLTRAQLLAAFEAALANYDVVMVKDGETIVLKPRDKAQIGGQIRTGAQSTSAIGYQIRAVPVNYGSADEIAKALETVTHAKMVLYSSDPLGLILLGGRAEELDNAVSTIALFDQSRLSEARIRFFPLSNAGASSVAADLDRVLKASSTSSVTVLALNRLNGVFAFSKSAQALDEVANWVQRLDVPSNDTSVRVWVYHPKGASAEALARTLNLVMGSGAEASDQGAVDTSSSAISSASARPPMTAPQQPVGSISNAGAAGDGQTRIVADKDTNSVIINAPESARVRLMDIIAQIDREPAQVFIEASILEVSLTNDFSYGVDWKAIADGGKLSLSSFSSSATSFPTAAPGVTVNYVGTDITAAVRALSSKSRVRIVSAPKITTIENATARLQVGDQVPIVTQSAQSTTVGTAPLINTVDYRDTGVKLEVTPRLTGDNRVSLLVTQEVSSVAKTQTSGIDSPTIKQRRMESQLIVPEGTVVALGGLISASHNDSEGGVPGLKNVPLVGSLFKGHQVSGDRTELVVLLQVRILRDAAGFNSLLGNLNADLKDNLNEGSWFANR